MRTPTYQLSRALQPSAVRFVAAAGLLVLAGCGGYGNSATPASSASGTAVTVRDAGGMKVLATSSGRTLYTSDQEKGTVLCRSSACVAVWRPLTVSAGQTVTSSGGLAGHLGTLKRQDGSRQVSFEGQPLYTFSFDNGAGQVNGNGKTDSFDGTHFSWHAATPGGAAPTSSTSHGSGYGSGY